jgi:ABC-type transport system involved in cytochrome c biogenesis permease subunit
MEPSGTIGSVWLKQARNAVLDRKIFIAITAAVVFVVGWVAWWNQSEFNPEIRPIAAVLRSNFWLAVHVIAILISYAAAFIAWGMSAVSLGYVIFGRYHRIEPEYEGQRAQIILPNPCQLFAPVVERLLKIALLLLIVGTVLGARWADYSWGRFWSWDPKEVWALITILFLVIVLHGKIANYYRSIGIFIGALFVSIAVVITWYGVNYVFSAGLHAYGGGTSANATLFLWLFIAINLLFGASAIFRYCAEVYSPSEMVG